MRRLGKLWTFAALTALLCMLSATMLHAKDKEVKFAIASDFHAPDMPDGAQRMQAFINAAQREQVDFIIELGDFCRFDEASRPTLDIWNTFTGKKYHVMGNHDMDRYTPEEYVKGMGMPGRYYSFDFGDFHFVVLDGNNLYDGKQYTHYAHANFYQPSWKRAYIDPEQMDWLRRDLASTNKRCILFSHQSIDRRMGNRNIVRNILEDENRRCGFQKVVMAFAGHDHTSYVDVYNDITYVEINSASYVWIGTPTGSEKRYSEAVNKKYTLMPYSIPYKQALYGIVTLNSKGIRLKGMQGEYVPPTPQDLHLPEYQDDYKLSPSVPDVVVKFKK